MMQENGAKLLGVNDPRSATIGVIHVAPMDDRESVLAAILTQEKLGRKVIVLELPAQNKAFQRPMDFDGLKNMRRKLQAQLIIAAPSGSGPSELARQRRFLVYSSLDSYADSLRKEGQEAPSQKRGLPGLGGLGGRRSQQPLDQTVPNENGGQGFQAPPPPPPPIFVNPEPPQMNFGPPVPQDEEEEPEPYRGMGPGIAAAGAIGAGGFLAGEALRSHEDEDADTGMQSTFMDNEDEDEDNAPLPPPIPIRPVGSAPIGGYPSQDDLDDEDYLPPPNAPALPPVVGPDPGINQYPRRSSGPVPVVPVPVPVASVAPHIPSRQSGNTGGRLPVPMYTPIGGNVPPRGNTPGGPPPRQPRRRGGARVILLALVALLLLSLLLCGGIALAAPGAMGGLGNRVAQIFTGSPTTTVTITPASQDLQKPYGVFAVIGTPNSANREVQARQLTATKQTQSNSESATGQGTTPATKATGTLTFYNALSFSQTVTVGTVVTFSGVQFQPVASAVIPPVNGSTLGSVNVQGQAVTAGTSGNISGSSTHFACCPNLSSVTVSHSAFTNGQNAGKFTFIKQSDVDKVANPLVAQLQPTAMSSIDGQKHVGEQFLANQPTCTHKVTSNPAVGSKVSSFTVAISVTCSGEVYDQSGAQTLAENLLKVAGDKSPGPPYMLSGSVVAGTPQIVSVDSKSGRITLSVNVMGRWVYTFSAAQQQQLVRLIAGKTKQSASDTLMATTGVSRVNINIPNGGTSLPTDVTQIKLVIQTVVGFTPTPTPTSPKATPTTGQNGTPTNGLGSGSPTPTAIGGS